MADGQFAGLTHFSTTSYSLFRFKQEMEYEFWCMTTMERILWVEGLMENLSGYDQYGMLTEVVVILLVPTVSFINLLAVLINWPGTATGVDVDWFRYDYAK